MPDYSPLRCALDTARIASRERGERVYDPGVNWGRGRSSLADCELARLHLCVDGMSHEKETHSSKNKRCLPLQYAGPSANLQILSVTTQAKRQYSNQGPEPPAPDAELSPRQPGFASLPTAISAN